MIQIGWVEGVCTRCGRTLRRTRPARYAVCDCYKYCPNCSPAYTVPMEPYTPDLTPSTYGPIESDTALGDTVHPIDILYRCPVCGYYSANLPVEVVLS